MVKVWAEKTVIPTYETGEAQKNPIFLDNRVYQGSCGKVYPYPTVDTISDEKKDKEYNAVYMENEYLKIMILPELGGRIQRAYDKTNGYDFVYYNHVIKPALVGLTGPWISGGIEFNWPQHHRPTTFMPVDYEIVDNEDGSKSVLCHDVDQMYGTKSIARFTLRDGRAYLEITGQLYNRTDMPQTFLWWANPAVAVNDNTQSVFPPDVHAVMDHGKRDVSRFPIATGVYYKKDYSEGVDISRYKNIPVPTSYMAEKSKYDFVGGYDYGKEAGILHVADHHISPGKKQWTWGCGDFGKAWDRNLTDEDGPYIELMTGVFTDNQPDFTWLKPFEEKTFTQYFMPYKQLGMVQNASHEAALHLSAEDGKICVRVYATGKYESARIILKVKDRLVLDETADISPVDVFSAEMDSKESEPFAPEDMELSVYTAGGRCIVSYRPEPEKIPELPEPARAAENPEKIMTNEELYLTGQHIEQYRHATYKPDPYYLEGLKRDPGDIRINNAYGSLLMRRGCFAEAQKYFDTAIKRLTMRNPNPYDSESFSLLGLSLFYQRRFDEAYDAFYKAAWSSEQQETAFYYLAAVDTARGMYEKAYGHIEKALIKNMHNIKARGLKAYLLRKLGKKQEAEAWTDGNLALDPFDFVSANERQNIVLPPENALMTARDYAQFGAYKEAAELLERCTVKTPMILYYIAFYRKFTGASEAETKDRLRLAEKACPDYCFPNKPEDIEVLEYAIEKGCRAKAPYYLGNLFYDKLQRERAIQLWELSAAEDDTFPTVFRNLSLAYFNVKNDREAAIKAMERAFALNPDDERVFLELDQLYRRTGMSFEKRLEKYEAHREIIERRDDLYIEYITLVNITGNHEKAYECIMGHHFHPWEGGEGKITAQYTLALLEMAIGALGRKQPEKAEELLRRALVYPENLGEGKLEGTKDNHIFYYLGLSLEMQGRSLEAQECFRVAVAGTDEPAGAMYYNDQPADMILYQGLAFLEMGMTREARSRFYRLIDYGERHLRDEVKIEYFAVSLPEFLIFNEDYTLRNHSHCCYLMALGNIGLGNLDKAEEFLNQTGELEPSHMMCRVYSDRIKKWF